MATVYAGHLLQYVMNSSLAKVGKPLITAQSLDYLLWRHGRELDSSIGNHHLTRTIMY